MVHFFQQEIVSQGLTLNSFSETRVSYARGLFALVGTLLNLG